MSDNSLAKLLYSIEPKIQNIEENRIELKALKDVYETILELTSEGEKSYDEILDFYDQEFIFRAIKIGNSNASELIDKYKSSRYLLKNKNPNLQELPQFKDAINYIQSLYQYLYGLCQKIRKDYEYKTEKLNLQEIYNKYYNLLKKDDIFIKDIDDFLMFLDLNEISISDKLNILILINKFNLKNYITTNDINIFNDIKLSDIDKMISQNQNLLNKKYNELENNVDLDKYIKSNITEIRNDIFVDRKIYLINEINKLYNEKKYSEIYPKYLEFNKIINIESELKKQNNQNGKLVFLPNFHDDLNNMESEYKNCILKNLLDIESNKELQIPNLVYKNVSLYIKDEFAVKTVYTFLNNGDILVLGILNRNETINDFINNKKKLFEKFSDIEDTIFDYDERNKILKDIKLEDLVLNIDLDTLDVKEEV